MKCINNNSLLFKGPTIVSLFTSHTPACEDDFFYLSIAEAGQNKVIFDCIVKKNQKAAEEAMRKHLKDVTNFSLSYNENYQQFELNSI